MKTILTTVTALAAAGALFTTTSRAEHHETKIKGEALCAKCELKETEKCQTAIRVKDGDKTVIYYAKDNKVAQDFHKNICTTTAKVIATGEVKEADGKKHITLATIELEQKK
jgi:hypothetical protein